MRRSASFFHSWIITVCATSVRPCFAALVVVSMHVIFMAATQVCQHAKLTSIIVFFVAFFEQRTCFHKVVYNRFCNNPNWKLAKKNAIEETCWTIDVVQTSSFTIPTLTAVHRVTSLTTQRWYVSSWATCQAVLKPAAVVRHRQRSRVRRAKASPSRRRPTISRWKCDAAVVPEARRRPICYFRQ